MITTKFDPDKPLRYVDYGRMSDEDQNPRSPDQQFAEIDREKKRQGRNNWVRVKRFRDDGISGRYTRKRPGYRRMLDEIRSGVLKVDAILVDTLERFGRPRDLQRIRDELRKKYGVLILTADTHFQDPTSVVGEMYSVMESARATSAAAQKAHDVLRGKIDAVQRKRWPGGPPPCGYRLAARTETITRRNGKTVENIYHVLEPDPVTAEIPRRVYQLAYDHGCRKEVRFTCGGSTVLALTSCLPPLSKRRSRSHDESRTTRDPQQMASCKLPMSNNGRSRRRNTS